MDPEQGLRGGLVVAECTLKKQTLDRLDTYTQLYYRGKINESDF